MRLEYLDRYSRADSLLHRLHPTAKLLAALAVVATVGAVPPTLWPLAPGVPVSLVHIAVAVVLLLLLQIASIPWSYTLVRWAALAPIVVLVSLSIPAARMFDSGWHLMGGVIVKAMLSLTTVLLLVNTTPFDRLLASLARLRVPGVLVGTLSFMYRYQFVLIDELTRMSRARQARRFRPRRWLENLDLSRLVGVLLLRSFERAERVHRAMRARGFDGQMRTLD